MDIGSCYSGAFYRATDLGQNERVTLTITDVALEVMPRTGDEKPVMRFGETRQRLALNKTNGRELAHAFGGETNDWIGQRIELFRTVAEFGGRPVPALRVAAISDLAAADPSPVVQDLPF